MGKVWRVDTHTTSCYWQANTQDEQFLFLDEIIAFDDRDLVGFADFGNEFVANEDEFFIEDIGNLGGF